MNEATNFTLPDDFIADYAQRQPPFGFGGLGYFVYMRTYSRIKEDGTNEAWHETVRRVVEGTYRHQKRHIIRYGLGWDEEKAIESAKEMFDRIWTLKFTPPGRGLWAMGTPVTEERMTFAALNNCAFTSTENIDRDLAKPFCFLMDMSMLGVGVGFDVRGAGKVTLHEPREVTLFYPIPDSREGWVNALKLLLESYFIPGRARVTFDYSRIRPKGELIKGFGGIASGPGPLRDMLEKVRETLTSEVGNPISERVIVDIMNLIGVCVVAGNVRRTAEIVFGPPSEQYLDLKNYEVNPDRETYGWASNNSIFAEEGMDYRASAERTRINGEPGYAWLDNMRDYSRMDGQPDFRDGRVKGGNPCLEQSLENYELCCLVETFPYQHDSLEDYKRTLKFAYLYAKTVTLLPTHWAETNRVMLRNRRIGTSMTGVAQFIENRGIGELKRWCEEGYDTIQYYDDVYSEWLCVPKSIKTTSIKPSGTVSLLAGATPGIHYPESKQYIRRVRLAADSPLVKPLQDAGYRVEPAVSDPHTVVVEFYVDLGENMRTIKEVSMWEQLTLAAFMQRYWADNQVSCTVTFKPYEGQDIARALDFFQYQLKGVSFLPKFKTGTTPYAQMPYEEITKEQYDALTYRLLPIDFSSVTEAKADVERFCSNDSCTI